MSNPQGEPREMADYKAFRDSLRCFTWVRGTKLSGASDADALIERNGRLLLIEGKQLEGRLVSVPWGQWRALRAFAALPGADCWLVAELPDEHAPNRYAVASVAHLAKRRWRTYPYKGTKAIRVWLDDLSSLSAEQWAERCDSWWDGPDV
jgi:hypothetical protein